MSLANKITFSRLILGPLFLWSFISDERYFSLIIFMLNLIGDFLDGYLARLRKEVTKLGKVLDPVVDFVFYIFLFLAFSFKKIPGINWFIFPIVFVILSSILFFFSKKKTSIIDFLSDKKIFYTKTKIIHTFLGYLLGFFIILNLKFQFFLWLTLIISFLGTVELLIRSFRYNIKI